MIDVSTALENILHARYGKDVRQSIHDGLYLVNESAKNIKVGQGVTSTTSSSSGFAEGNLYLNNSTWDLWQCKGTNSWELLGNIKGGQGTTNVGFSSASTDDFEVTNDVLSIQTLTESEVDSLVNEVWT